MGVEMLSVICPNWAYSPYITTHTLYTMKLPGVSGLANVLGLESLGSVIMNKIILLSVSFLLFNNNYFADGPGSSTVGIENKMNRCLLNWSQYAWIDEETNEQKQSDQINITVQCSVK